MRTQAVEKGAEGTGNARQILPHQVEALASAKLNSGLDVSFASVNLSEARILLASARNEHRAAMAELSAAMGYDSPQPLELVDLLGPESPPPPLDQLIATAASHRPELAAIRLEQQSAARQLAAENALKRPTLSAYGAVGAAPAHDERMRGRYAAGVVITFPVFNGHLLKARQAEAAYRAQTVDHRARHLRHSIARDVAVAALALDTAYQNLSLTRQLLEQAQLALHLAQERYRLGLSSFIEVSQAQLNSTNAQIRHVTARYDYLIQRSVLDYQTGQLR